MKSYETLKTIFKNERLGSFVFWFGILVFVDQLAKYFAFRFIKTESVISVSDVSLFGLQLYKNYDFAFSLPVLFPVIIGIYLVVLFVIFRYVWKNFTKFDSRSFVAWVFILSGALSNVVERIFFGYVKDFVYILGGGIFNFADFYILFGIVLLFSLEFRRKKL